MDKKIERFIKLYPWYAGLTSDLLFYVAIGSLFLTVVRGFTTAEIVSLTTVSTIASITLQFPVLWIIKKVGNTVSARLSGFFMLLSALCYTFGPTYYVVLFGGIFHNVSTIFLQVSFVTLENNLDIANRHSEFIKIRASGNKIYAILTMLVSFVASLLFNLNHYLPMICCVLASLSGFIISFFMVDYSGDEGKEKNEKQPEKKAKISYGKTVIITLAAYGIFFALVTSGQTNQKLFIQEHLFLDFNVDNTALILGAILTVSRVVRVISNGLFVKLYEKMGQKIGHLLSALLFSSYALSVIGSFIPPVAVKLTVMGLGYVILLFVRDPFTLYIQDIIFENTPKEQHRTLITMMRFGVKLVTAGLSTAATLLLLKFPLIVVIMMMGALAVIEILLCLYLYKAINSQKKAKALQKA